MYDLEYNINKLNRCLIAIKHLSNPKIYYNSSYKPQYNCDRANREYLKRTVKNANRLIKVINKQSEEQIKILFPYYKHRYSWQNKQN
jgi:DNA-directed RNA polymerase specialized sigma54-like protein